MQHQGALDIALPSSSQCYAGVWSPILQMTTLSPRKKMKLLSFRLPNKKVADPGESDSRVPALSPKPEKPLHYQGPR